MKKPFNPIKAAGHTYMLGSAMHLAFNALTGAKSSGFSWAASGLFISANFILGKWGGHKVAMQTAHGILAVAGGCLAIAGVSNTETAVLFSGGHAGALALSTLENKADNKYLQFLIKNRGLVAGGFSLISRAPFIKKVCGDVIEQPTLPNVAIAGAVAAWSVADVLLCAGKINPPNKPSEGEPQRVWRNKEDTRREIKTNQASEHLAKTRQ